jgi:hypothetical protein
MQYDLGDGVITFDNQGISTWRSKKSKRNNQVNLLYSQSGEQDNASAAASTQSNDESAKLTPAENTAANEPTVPSPYVLVQDEIPTSRPWLDIILCWSFRFSVLAILAATIIFQPFAKSPRDHDVWIGEGEAVHEAFIWSWETYKSHAWGHDGLNPISKQPVDHMHMAEMVIDNLDTLWIMGEKREFQEAKTWILNNFYPERCHANIELYQVNTKILGGLLSAYILSKDNALLTKAVQLANHVSNFISMSPSGIPLHRINMSTPSMTDVPNEIYPAGHITMLLELRQVASITGNDTLMNIVDHAEQAIENLLEQIWHDSNGIPGLIPSHIRANPPAFQEYELGQGFLYAVDENTISFYEYFLIRWLASGRAEHRFLELYLRGIRGIQDSLFRYSSKNLTYVGEVRNKKFESHMSQAACRLPGILALGYQTAINIEDQNASPELAEELNLHVKLAEQLLGFCVELHTITTAGVIPQAIWFDRKKRVQAEGAKVGDTGIRVRRREMKHMLYHDTAKSLMYLQQMQSTRDSNIARKYQEFAWQIFLGMEVNCRYDGGGYHGLENAYNLAPIDEMPVTFLSQTLKYLQLTFLPRSRMHMNPHFLSVEGHYLMESQW